MTEELLGRALQTDKCSLREGEGEFEAEARLGAGCKGERAEAATGLEAEGSGLLEGAEERAAGAAETRAIRARTRGAEEIALGLSATTREEIAERRTGAECAVEA